MRYWLLVVICLMLVISVAAEPDSLDLEPITPDNVARIEVLRQFGEPLFRYAGYELVGL